MTSSPPEAVSPPNAEAALPPAVADPAVLYGDMDWGQQIQILTLAHESVADMIRHCAARIAQLEAIVRRHLPSEGL